MSERDFPPLGGRDSPVSAQQLNPKDKESYSNALRKSPPAVTPFVPLGSNLDNPMNPYLPPPAGRRTKINKDKNEYRVMERVERVWYSHDLDLNGLDLDEEIEVWSDGEGEVLKEDAQLDALIVLMEAGGVWAATLQGIADNFNKCDKIKLDLPATNLLNTPRVEVPRMPVLSFGSHDKPTRSPKNRGVAPKSVAGGIILRLSTTQLLLTFSLG
jgi:hypothetical protein